jgi:hypothetical protein
MMRQVFFLLCNIGLLVSPINTWAEAADNALSPQIETLTTHCHQQWKQYGWTIGQYQDLAADNAAFNQGIQRICQAKSELFIEGYEVQPLIDEDSQEEIFRLVFLPTVDIIKAQIKVYLPQLRVL